jgi:DNA replication protein DnaC
LRARAAGLDAGMRVDTWDESAAVGYDRQLWNELASLRFPDEPHGAVILGPVGVGKTHLACALGHIAIRRRRTVHMASAPSCSNGSTLPGSTTPWTTRCAVSPEPGC